jgi:hypothetical protein
LFYVGEKYLQQLVEDLIICCCHLEILPDINKHSYIKLPGLFKTRLSHDSVPLKFFNPPSLQWHAASHWQTLSHNVKNSNWFVVVSYRDWYFCFTLSFTFITLTWQTCCETWLDNFSLNRDYTLSDNIIWYSAIRQGI